MRITCPCKIVALLFLFYIPVFSSAPTLLAQGRQPDTAFVQLSVNEAIGAYRQSIKGHAHLYSGSEYVDYRQYLREGHQFFLVEDMEEGSVLFEGAWYTQVPMMYDVIKDELVINVKNSSLRQKLIKEKVASFSLLNHYFVHLKQDSVAGTILQPGYYNLLHQAGTTVLAKRSKIIEEEQFDQRMKDIYVIDDKYFLRKGDTYYKVWSKGSVLKVLKDKKKELRKYARTKELDFRTAREYGIVALAAYYDTLTK